MVLLSFFILQFSMSTVTRQTFERKIATLTSALPNLVARTPERTPLPGQTALDRPTAEFVTAMSDALTETLGYPSIESDAGSYQFRGGITVGLRPPAIVLELGGSSFPPDSDEITFIAKEALLTLGRTLHAKTAPNSIRVEIAGHTDAVPLGGGDFASNWELSTARALAASRQIIDAGVEAQAISVIGYAGSKPVSDSESRVGRYRNRRIEIRIMPAPDPSTEPVGMTVR